VGHHGLIIVNFDTDFNEWCNIFKREMSAFETSLNKL